MSKLLDELDMSAAEWDAMPEWMKPIGVGVEFATRDLAVSP